ncbi:cytochrome C [Massilia sp. WF1]|uniref:c-type cytochrome n=1 Tax=unclassified Massilia TaxID=2609279 RepID=UPI000649EA97|nr:MULTISPECIES: cytochrome c [unclassified Massilia]ALK98898.1 cytochrome C [Massilia sp. WG5]KLU38554.1 cytochrome C [Massilia sp. WF1]
MRKPLAVLLFAGVATAAGAAAAADVVANPKAAPQKIEQCIGCHGIPEYKTAFPEVYQVPMIGGQSAKYIEAALQAYKKGDRKHPQMTPTARVLSDQDIADIAAYYSQQTAATPNK